METARIIRQLERPEGGFPRAALEAAVVNRDAVTPELLRILERSVERAEEFDDLAGYSGHLYALYLLAQFRETRTLPLLLRFEALPPDVLDGMFGDIVTEDLPRIQASVCGGELARIHAVIEDEAADKWVRVAGLNSLVTLVACGQTSREQVVAYFGDMFRGKLARTWSPVWDGLVSSAADIYPEELMDDIRKAYAEDLVDSGSVGLEDVESDLAMGKEAVLARLAADRRYHLVENAILEMAWWASPPPRSRGASKIPPTKVLTPEHSAPTPKPVKTGRNEPCPCGSGKKFKKCCGS